MMSAWYEAFAIKSMDIILERGTIQPICIKNQNVSYGLRVPIE